MAKYYGMIGYATYPETVPDVHKEVIAERPYSGDVIKDTRKWIGSEHQNDNLNVSNRISIVSDPFAYANFHSIRYCEYMGSKWKVTNVEVAYPRLILDLGGVYNEQTPSQ